MQEHIITGEWQRRHLDAMVDDTRTRALLAGLLSCSTHLLEQQQQQQWSNSHDERQLTQKKQSMRNMLCLCSSVCPDETEAWTVCVRKAAKAIRDQEPVSPESCEAYRVRLERCTQRQTSLLLRAALVPPDRDGLML